MKTEQVSIPGKDPPEEDDLDKERAEHEGMVQREWTDEELAEILADDLLKGSTPG